MNSWEIIKARFVEGTNPGTFGRHRAVGDAANLFVRLMGNLVDKDEAVASMNADDEVAKAIGARPLIDEMKQAGVAR